MVGRTPLRLGEVRVVECLLRGRPLRWVESKHFFQQIHAVGIELADQLRLHQALEVGVGVLHGQVGVLREET